MSAPRLLDLFCGAGGCGAGYVRAGFEAHGVDLADQPRYLLSGASSFTRADAMRAALEDRGLDADAAWTLVGIRAADSLQRRQAMLTTGGVNAKRRIAYPVWDWHKDDLLRVVRESGVQLAPDYRVWGQTFDGVDERFMVGLREHYPEDYERVRALYGAVDADRARWRFGRG